MATSGSKSVAIFSWITMKFSWEQTEQSIANNYTSISWKLELITNGGALYRYDRPWTVTIDGTSYTGKTTIDLDSSDQQTVATGTAVINHHADGTKPAFSYSFVMSFDLTLNSGKYMGSYSGTGSDSLTTIPRKSSLTVANGILSVAQTLTITKQANAFTHTITYKCGSKSGTICDKSSATSISWTPPVDLATEAPADNSVPVTLTIETYNGSTLVGTDTEDITCDIPYTNTFVPVLLPSVSDTLGFDILYGASIQYNSRLKVDIETYGAYGAWIKSVETVFEGETYPGTDVTTNFIKGYGSLPVKITTTDSRGRKTEATIQKSVLEYQYPQIPTLKAYRSDASGNANSSGTYVAVKFTSKVTSLNNKNQAKFAACQRAVGAASYTDIDTSAYDGKYSVTNGLVVFAADPTKSYEILFSVYDWHKTTTKYASAAPVEKVFSMLKSAGKIVGIAFGKIAEFANCFDIGWQTRFSGGILQPVLKDATDFNEIRTPNTYTCRNFSTAGYLNCPLSVSSTGTLIVEACGESGEVHQTLMRASKGEPVKYERFYYGGAWGAWTYVGGDFIVEQGTSNGWTYRKWYSGVAECWKILEHSTTVATQWGSLYVGNATERQNYPFAFTSKPVEVVSITSGSEMGFLYPERNGNGVNGAYASARYNVCALSAISTAVTYYFNFHVTGKWK